MNKKKRSTLQDFKKDALQDKQAQAEYNMLETEFAFLEQCIKAKKRAHCSPQSIIHNIIKTLRL